jgi:putative phosphoesterase
MTLDYLVLSDTHGRSHLLRQVAKKLCFRPTAILLLGDGLRDLDVLQDIPSLRDVPVHAVSGNCDSFFSFRESEPTCRVVPAGNHRIFMTHGHLYGVRGGISAAMQNAIAADADVLLYGHTHVATEYTYTHHYTDENGNACEKHILVANPGSLGEPRDGGPHRFGVLTLTEQGTIFGHGEVDY